MSEPQATVTEDIRREKEHFFGAAKLLSGLTVLSRIAGMVRASAIASLGANALTDAFSLAFAIPNLFRRLFAEGALSSAFVPGFTEAQEKEGFPKAAALLANAMGLLAVFLAALMLVVQACLLAWLAVADKADTQLCLLLTTIMMPFMVTVCLLALGAAALNCRGHFAYPAATPIMLNLIIVAAAWWIAPLWRDLQDRLIVVAASVTVAGAVQLVGIFWLLRRTGFRMPFRLRPIEPGIGRMLRMMAPMLLGLGLLQVAELGERMVAWVLRSQSQDQVITLLGWQLEKPLTEGVMQRLDAARFLYQFPLGVLAISLGVAVFPLLSRYAARGDTANLRDSVNRALRLSFMEGAATGVGLIVLAEPITRLIFMHGNFTAADAATSAAVLQAYAAGMWAYCTYQILLRSFYSLKDARTPLKIACVMGMVELVLVSTLVFVPQLRERAFGVAVALAFSLNSFVQAAVLRRRLGPFGGRKLLASAARSCVAAAVMAGSIEGLLWWLGPRPDWLTVLVCVPAGAATFVGCAWAMRAPELAELLGSFRRRSREGAQE
jgi:putative peptidoglycan lipid II flippase